MSDDRHFRRVNLINQQIAAKYKVWINFQCAPEEALETMLPSLARDRSNLLWNLVPSSRPVVVDAFAGNGIDSIVLMGDFPYCSLYAVQVADSEDERARFLRLTHNVSAFNAAVRKNLHCAMTVPASFDNFISGFAKTIDVLYLDPPPMEGHMMQRMGIVVNNAGVHMDVIVVKSKEELSDKDRCVFDSHYLVGAIPVTVKEVTIFYFYAFKSIYRRPDSAV